MTSQRETPSTTDRNDGTSPSNLRSTLKELDCALDEWNRITNNPEGEQDQSRAGLEKRTQELLQKLQEQIAELSVD